MERKTKHRLLGIVVLVGLAVLLVPLLQTDKTLSTHTAVMKAPPFPDQPVQVSSDPEPAPMTTPVANTPAPATPAPDPDDDMPDSASLNPPLPIQQNINRDEQPDDTITMTHVSSDSETIVEPSMHKSRATQSISKPKTMEPTAQVSTPATASPVSAIRESDIQNSIANENMMVASKDNSSAKFARTVVKTFPKKSPLNAKLLPDKMRSVMNGKALPKGDNGLTEITNAGWVIQVGSFKNKTSALRMVNHLRANGYRAFMQKTSTTFGENTRVFIGPETKQHSAFSLADQLESDLHIRGIVVSYKPLAL